jgi:hypothetical protein
MTKRKRIKVYVAGGSDEPHVAAGFIARLEAAGLEVTFNWAGIVAKNRQDGLTEEQMPREQRRQHASDDRAGVQACEVLWLLVPPSKTEGGFWELGHADALEKLCVVSGSHRNRSIFSALSDLHFDDHESAFLFLLDLADGATWSVATPEQAARILAMRERAT